MMQATESRLKYKEVEREMRQLALTLPPGAMLPAERHLAVSYNCNFQTVRKALKALVVDGLIIRRVGSGTFVAERPVQQNGHSRLESKSLAGPSVQPKANRVGILVYQGGDNYANSLLQAISHVALSLDIELRSCWIRDFSNSGPQIEQLMHEGCAALTLPWFPLEMTEEAGAFVRRSPIPVSLPMIIPGLEEFSFLQKDFFGNATIDATRCLCRYFQLLGHERIAILGPDSPKNAILQHMLGSYSCYTSREDLGSLLGLVGPGSAAMDALAQRWLKYKGALAIISYDDEHALRFMTSMHKLGCSAPEDFCIVGYNNTEASRFSDPPLTTVMQDFDHIATWLLRHAVALSQGKSQQSDDNSRNPLIIRSTCGGKGKISELLKAEMPDFAFIEEELAVV